MPYRQTPLWANELNTANPNHGPVLKARQAEYQAIVQFFNRFALRDDYKRANIAERKAMLTDTLKDFMKKRYDLHPVCFLHMC